MTSCIAAAVVHDVADHLADRGVERVRVGLVGRALANVVDAGRREEHGDLHVGRDRAVGDAPCDRRALVVEATGDHDDELLGFGHDNGLLRATKHGPCARPASGYDTAMRWDAGDLGCNRLIFQLHLKMKDVAPGEIIEVVARDPGAPIDLPAWCRTTGHALEEAEHPVYRIRRKPS